ncbi:PQQ-dependent dehydrogenase, methanol/ethanol family [Sphingobium sp. EP60837]|uniref:PQQ-dependent dehydrogenase, methanol/ethanol family n=1 Tax=Sphingobium sp. EP60837 TaxID=1855519 RepID=UPI0007DE1D7E|nr:PQQ-dependent dehydrogenase, methanol/ethanol family [Sphingobium sp. EP60837]ANI80092.1 Quinoprotein glucose dehydrogenase (PQQ, quinone) [Sphingobium sp. EP60837]
MGKNVLSALLALSLASTLAGCGRASSGNGDWPSYGRTADEQRFSPLNQIDLDTVTRLGLAWYADVDTDRGQEGTPLVADGAIYTSTAWSKVFAFDAVTGAKKWQYDPKVPGQKAFQICCDVVNRGIALWKDKVIVGTLDGRLVGINRTSGNPDWTVQTTPVDEPYSITGAPRIAHGLVIIGNAGSDYGVRGFVSAYNPDTGKLVWRFYLTPRPDGKADGAASDDVMKSLVEGTWSDGAWKITGGGGSPWDAITYDPQTELIYIGTGNPVVWNDRLRTQNKGDNLFVNSIVALHAKTGKYAWHYQTTPRDAWDYDAVQHLIVADIPLRGSQRHVVMQASKNGFFYVLDAIDGKLISAKNYVPVTWASGIDMTTGRPIETPEARFTETGRVALLAPASAHSWQPMSYSPETGLVYLPAISNSRVFGDVDELDYVDGAKNMAVNINYSVPGPHGTKEKQGPAVPSSRTELIAWDPIKQAARWRVPTATWPGGTLTTAGKLVFQASGRHFIAYDAASGKAAWDYDLGAPAIGSPITYEIGRTQYVALLVGFGGSGGFGGSEPRRQGRLMVFKIDGNAKAPAYPEYTPPPLLDVAKAEPSSGDADHGATLYSRYCVTCHLGGVFLPNLARSPVIMRKDALNSVLLDGALAPSGMASFKQYFKPADVEDLRAFLLWRAKDGEIRVKKQGGHG